MPEKKKYKWNGHESEIKTLVLYLVIHYGPVSKTRLVELCAQFGMEFGQTKWADSAVGKSLTALKSAGLIVGMAMASDKDGQVEEHWKVAREMLKNSFQFEEGHRALKPIISGMSLKTNPDTREWVIFLEQLLEGAKATKERDSFITIWIKLKALSVVLGVKALHPLEEEKLCRSLGVKYDDNNHISFFRRVGAGQLILPNRGLRKAIQEAAPDLWGADAEYKMNIGLLPFDPTDYDKDYEQPCYYRPPGGTFVATYPVVREGGTPGNRAAVKRAETVNPGFYVEGYIHVAQSKGLLSVLVPLSQRRIYMGGQRGQGQGEFALADYEILGDTLHPETIRSVNIQHDKECADCSQRILELMGTVITPGGTSIIKDQNKSVKFQVQPAKADMASLNKTLTTLESNAKAKESPGNKTPKRGPGRPPKNTKGNGVEESP